MQDNHVTSRLSLKGLTLNDAEFIKDLVNTPGWLKFIGERNVKSNEDAVNYIQKILDNPNARYWVVRLIDTSEAIGVVTLIKRDYLEHHDIGFAFLPQHTGKGYAYEATNTILSALEQKTMLAITIKENTNSISLLEKLGFSFSKQLEQDNEQLQLYTRKV